MKLSESYQKRIIELAGIDDCLYFFHVSDVYFRDSIMKHGIDYKKGISPWESPEDKIDFPKGNYFWATLKEAEKYAGGLSETFDIWEICIKKSEIISDPITKGGFYTTNSINPSKIRLIKTVGPDSDMY